MQTKRSVTVDYILIGQGLAGSVLAWELLRRGKKVLVFNQPAKNYSSRVAAGLFNPVTGRRFVKTWRADQVFPFLHGFYPEMEEGLSSRFFHKIPLFRPFLSIEEQNKVISNSTEDSLGRYIDRIHMSPMENFPFKNTYGGMLLKHTGYVDIPSLMQSMRDYLLRNQCLIEEAFQEDKLIIHDHAVGYGEIEASMVIYCNGLNAAASRYFRWLPFRPVKGEILHVEIEESFPLIYNRSMFVLPVRAELCKIGSTYDWDHIDTVPSIQGKNELETKLNEVLIVNFKTIDHLAGIRPATKDRRPFIGVHPGYKQIGVFNGMGSKGVSLVPYFATQFVNFMESDGILDKDVNIERYISLYR